MSGSSNYNKWVIRSVSAHTVLLLTVLFAGKLAFYTKHNILFGGSGDISSSINVDMVGLPNILKKDLDAIKPTEHEMTLPDPKKIRESKRNAIQQLKETVKQELSYIKKIKIIKGLKEEHTGIGGVESGTPTQADPYFSTVKDFVRTYWKIPGWLKSDGLNTLVLVKINENGDLTEVAIEKSSGNDEFDKIAINSVKNATPFPTPPVAVKDTLQQGIILSFP